MKENKIEMANPWLEIPASDYEDHMSSPNVGQLPFLANVFQESVENYDAKSIALLGCATGNGLECVKSDVTRRVTVVDINPGYLKVLRQRYGTYVPGLEVVEADLEICTLESNAFSLIFAGLLFEYVNPQILLPKIADWLNYEGIMVSVLQLPEKNIHRVSDTAFPSLKLLNSIMKLMTAQEFQKLSKKSGLLEVEGKEVTLETGKSFYIGTYEKIA